MTPIEALACALRGIDDPDQLTPFDEVAAVDVWRRLADLHWRVVPAGMGLTLQTSVAATAARKERCLS